MTIPTMQIQNIRARAFAMTPREISSQIKVPVVVTLKQDTEKNKLHKPLVPIVHFNKWFDQTARLIESDLDGDVFVAFVKEENFDSRVEVELSLHETKDSEALSRAKVELEKYNGKGLEPSEHLAIETALIDATGSEIDIKPCDTDHTVTTQLDKLVLEAVNNKAYLQQGSAIVDDFMIAKNRPLTFGRSRKGNDIIVVEDDDCAVSRNHGYFILKDDGKLYILDKGSKNGILLRGELIDANKEYLVEKGDIIGLGEAKFRVFY